jgi:hypothetical protein
MALGNSIPGRRSRFLRVLSTSMFTSVVFGLLGYICGILREIIRTLSVNDIHIRALMTGLNTTAVAFWILFAVLMLYEFSKSEAVLDLERRNRLAEELFKRDKRRGLF